MRVTIVECGINIRWNIIDDTYDNMILNVDFVHCQLCCSDAITLTSVVAVLWPTVMQVSVQLDNDQYDKLQ